MFALKFLRTLAVALALALPVLATAQSGGKFTHEQLDQMLAQIALYPDSLLSQVLMAATYPDEFQAAYTWSKAHPDAKGDDAVKQVESQNWDPSVASLVAFPEVIITLGEKPDYVKNLGDAFLAQPDDVMNSVQRLRAAAEKAGNLKSNEQIKVSTQPAASPPPPPPQAASAPPPPAPTQTIVIEPAQPSVVYVPTYNPTVVYGPWWYPSYPPYYYPPPPGYWFSGAVAAGVATGIAWGVGIGISNALWGGFDWNRHDVNINVNRYNNINVNKRLDVNSNRVNWSHDTNHRQASYRGGDATRQQLDQKRASVNREQYRGREGNRDASRERAMQTMQQHGVQAPGGSAMNRAESLERDRARDGGFDRGGTQQRAHGMDRDAAQQRMQGASRDNALKGANGMNARAEQARGQSSLQRAGGDVRAHGGGGGQVGAARGGGGPHMGGGGGRPGGGGHGGGRHR